MLFQAILMQDCRLVEVEISNMFGNRWHHNAWHEFCEAGTGLRGSEYLPSLLSLDIRAKLGF